MKALRALLVVMFWVILPAGSLSAEKPLSVQLREGKYKEQLEGDLDGAIEIYRMVIQRADEGRRYAAEAHYRMGMCYLKKDDKTGAAEQFSIVTNEYSAQTATTDLARQELKKLTRTAPRAIEELSVDDGRSGGRESINGGGHAVRFESPTPASLTGIRIYGSRYGSPQAPKEDFHIWLCDKHFTVLEEFTFPYSRFTRGDPRWVTLKTDQVVLPREFFICAGFNPQRTKGVYVHHDAHASGNSYIGLPGREMRMFERGDWMIRPILSSTPAKKADVNMTVETAVKIISTCAEGDPRVTAAMATVKDLDESAVVSELKKYLTSEQATIRRAAIYVLWQGEFSNIDDAIPELERLCSHEEYLTRGMAGLALGQNKILSSFAILEKMTLDDPSGYARRCGAYALGLLGDTKAKPTLEKALNDPDSLVQNNAKAALKMLELESSKAGPVTNPIANNRKKAKGQTR